MGHWTHRDDVYGPVSCRPMEPHETHTDDVETGASMVEYALLVVLIAIVALVAVTLAGSTLSSTYSDIASAVTEAGN